MLTETRYCRHCNSRYTYYRSGTPDTPYNDHDYCPNCKKIIVDALRKSAKPTTYEGYQLLSEMDKELVVARLKELIEEESKDVNFNGHLFKNLGGAFVGGLLKGKFKDGETNEEFFPRYLYYNTFGEGFVVVGSSYKDLDDAVVYLVNDYESSDDSLIGHHCYRRNDYDSYNALMEPWCNVLKRMGEIKPIDIGEPLGKLFYFDWKVMPNEKGEE